MNYEEPACAYCPASVRACRLGESPERGPGFCPTKVDEQGIDTARAEYERAEVRRTAHVSAQIESEGYCRWTRLEENVAFAGKMGVKRIGIATCISFVDHATVLSGILESHGFEVASVACKNGSIDKREIGLREDRKIRPGGHESMCNPVSQALLLNRAGCELNIVLGGVCRPRKPVLPLRRGADHGAGRQGPGAGAQPDRRPRPRRNLLRPGLGAPTSRRATRRRGAPRDRRFRPGGDPERRCIQPVRGHRQGRRKSPCALSNEGFAR